MAGALKESNTRWLSSPTDELCDRLSLLLQEKQAGNNPNVTQEEVVATADKLLEYKFISTNDVYSSTNSINNIKEMISYFKNKNHISKKKYKNDKMLTTIIKSFDTIGIIATTSSSITLSHKKMYFDPKF